jgi:hypothetical protein
MKYGVSASSEKTLQPHEFRTAPRLRIDKFYFDPRAYMFFNPCVRILV